MHILVSFCNLRASQLPSLGLLDPSKSDFKILQLPAALHRIAGITGLAMSNRFVYAVAQRSNTPEGKSPDTLLIFDSSDFKLLDQYEFRLASDVHSLLLSDGLLYAVSTGTDEVLSLRIKGDRILSESVFWRPEPDAPRLDTHHLNAIYQWQGDLFISAFGKKEQERWASANDGFIMNLSRNEKLDRSLNQPHSILVHNEKIIFCESRKMAVRMVGSHRLQRLPGYTRGLCLINQKLFVGTSVGRQISKSTREINNPVESGDIKGQCTISRLSPQTFKVEEVIDLSVYAQEIYDLLPVSNADHWPVEHEIAWRDVAIIQLGSALEERTSRAKRSAEEKEEKERALVDMVAERQGAVESLAEQLKEKQEKEQSLVELVAERQSAVQMLIEQLKEKERKEQLFIEQAADRQLLMESLSNSLTHQREELVLFETQLAEVQGTAQSLSVRVDEKENTIRMRDESINRLQGEVSEYQQRADRVQAELSEYQQNIDRIEAANQSLKDAHEKNEHTIQKLSSQLAVKEAQLERINRSIGWRLLSRYGRIKYRYLLPVYRLLGLAPYGKTSAPGLNVEVEAIQPSSEVSDEGVQETQAVAERAAFADVRDLCESNAFDVICFPIINWDFRFQRPQQLMSRFAAAGHRVFYVAQTFHSHGPAYTIREKRKNVYEVYLRGAARNPYTDALDDEARDELFDSLNELRRDLLLGASVAFAQLPFWYPLVEKTRSQFAWPIIYDCMDYHAGFSTNRPRMITQECDLLATADLVVVSSTFLGEQASHVNSKVLVVRNACDYEHFARASKDERDGPLIGYYGAIADWFDSDLVADLATRRPDWDFVLVGSTFSADIRRLSKLPNVSLPGEKHYSEIPDWLGKFDVMIIPFKRTALTEATNPVKAYEVLASGKPLVSVPIPEMSSLAPLVRLASSAEEFESEIIEALDEDDSEIVEKRRAFAREHTWEKRYDVLAPEVRDVFPRASIIVVTFNNVKLNRLCIESLYSRTAWPNFEVIVLDNASSDGTRDYLKEAEQDFPNLRVILNDTNLGFARANNIGLGQATGEYLVLLNNDTAVTRGWLAALIRHLHSDPEIGLIGPVTNEIGNEAKVPVGYTRLEEMPAWAADYVRENDNHLFDIPVLAMFCVAMRREVFERVGPLDESFEVGMFEDDDYARRMREAGYKVVCVDDSFIHHFGRASFKLLSDQEYREIFQRNRSTYEKKWGPWVPHVDRQTRQRSSELLADLSDRKEIAR